MTNASKGVLLSALVLPGLGQFILQRKIRGTMLMAGFSILVTTLLVQILAKAMTILNNINIQVDQIDVTVISAAVSRATGGTTSMFTSLLGIYWLLTVIDAYLLGKKMDSTK